ncbi:MAG: DNA recombination-mediator protein A, partial [Dolichospermum sp.]
DNLSLAEASYLCNKEIVSRCQQLICFAFHDSRTLLQTCSDAEEQRKVVTLFYFD